jgi:hypothetical protein
VPPLGHFSLIRFAKDSGAEVVRPGFAQETYPAARAAS